MNTHAKNRQENKSQTVANSLSREQSAGNAAMQFVDNRSGTVAQRKLHELANNSSQVQVTAQLQEMADNSYEQQYKPTQLILNTEFDNVAMNNNSTIQRVLIGNEALVDKYAIHVDTKKYYKIISFTPQQRETSAKYSLKSIIDADALPFDINADNNNYYIPETTGAVFNEKKYYKHISKDADEKLLKEEFIHYENNRYVVNIKPENKKGSYKAATNLFPYIDSRDIDTRIKGKLLAFFNPTKTLNINETYESISDKYLSKTGYKDWYHGFSHTINLLAGRSDTDAEKMKKIIKYQLTQFQIQATYSVEDSERLGRQTSPLVLQGYARGIKTGLWNLNRKFQEDAVNKQLQKARVDTGAKLDKKFYVFPANKAFEMPNPDDGEMMTLAVKDDVPADVNSGGYECLYINSLNVQLVRFSTTKSKSKNIGPVHSFMGGKGLRTSAGESADKAAEQIVKYIKDDNVAEAMNYVKQVFETDSEPTSSDTNRKDVSTESAFGKLEFNSNTMIVPISSSETDRESIAFNPLTSTLESHLVELEVQYSGLIENAGNERLPFFIQQNIEIVKNLINGSIGISRKGKPNFFDQKTPTTISIELSDAIHGARLIIKKYLELNPEREDHSTVESLSPESNILIETFYQKMQNIHHVIRFQLDWKGEATSLDSALRGMLPPDVKAPTLINAAPHGLELIHHIQQSLPAKHADSVAFMEGSYYETPELFPGGEKKSSVSDNSLKDKKVIVMEPHPNNAADKDIHPHDPLVLLDTLFKGDNSSGPYTVIMDVTLNHLGENQIQDVLQKAEEFIKSGRLNLILLQSGTKFFQNGMDLVNIGTSLTFNNGEENWGDFNQKMQEHAENLPDDDKTYIANMLSKNKEPLKKYLIKIRENTSYMRKTLTAKLESGENAFQMCGSSDQDTVYISFMPKPAFTCSFLSSQQKQTKEEIGDITAISTDKLSSEDVAMANKELYFKKLLPALKAANLPSVDRPSFGFNVTNFGECYTTVRITPGIESKGLLNQYANIVASVGKDSI